MKKLRNLLCICLLAVAIFTIGGCVERVPVAPKYYSVTFDYGYEASSGRYVTKRVQQGRAVAEIVLDSDSRYEDNQEYTFLFWTLGGKRYDFASPVRDNITLVAQWNKVDYVGNTYTVTFVDYDGKVLAVRQVREGDSAVAPTVKNIDEYTVFIGWDKAFDRVVSDLTVVAQYRYNLAGDTVLSFRYDSEADGYIIFDCSETIGFAVALPSQYYGKPVVGIDDRAFAGKKITSVYIPGTVRKIGNYAFADCSELRSVVFNEGLEEIGDYAFAATAASGTAAFTNKLTDISIPSTVRSIGKYAFAYAGWSYDGKEYRAEYAEVNFVSPSALTLIDSCAFFGSNIISVVLPDGMAGVNLTIGDYAFAANDVYWAAHPGEVRQSVLTEIFIPRHVVAIAEGAFLCAGEYGSLSGNLLTKKHRTISLVFDDKCDVRSISSRAFYSVQFEDNISLSQVRRIGDYAFYGGGYKSVRLDLVEEIGVRAFTGNYDIVGATPLNDIYLGNNLRTIGECAFDGAGRVDALFLPSTVIEIGKNAFHAIGNLTMGFSLTVPYSVSILGEQAFADSGVTSVKFDSQVGVSRECFARCSKLSRVSVAAGVPSIGERAFNACESLYYVYLGDSVSDIAVEAFAQCNMLEYINFPVALRRLGDRAFFGVALHEVSLPTAIEYMGNKCFAECTSLTKVNLDCNLTAVPSGTFSGCESLSEIKLSDMTTDIGYMAFGSCKSLTTVRLPDSIRSIGSQAFAGCELLTKIIIPSQAGEFEIGAGAFNGTALERVEVERGNLHYSVADNVSLLYDKKLVLLADVHLRSYDLPGNVEEIGSGAFSACYLLTHISLSSSLVRIQPYAFSGTADSSLSGDVEFMRIAEVDFSHAYALTEIGEGAFAYNYVMDTLDMRGAISLKKIDDFAFFSCAKLATVILPSSLQYIGKFAFSGSSSSCVITSLNLGGVEEIGESAFAKQSRLTSLSLPSSLTKLGINAFYGCSSLKTLDIGSGIVEISAESFKACSSLTSLHFDNARSLLTIGEAAFEDCTSLTTVDMSGTNIYEIGAKAFMGNRRLVNVYFSDATAVIGAHAFEGDTRLGSLTFGRSLLSIGECAFYSGSSSVESELYELDFDKAVSLESIGDRAFMMATGLTRLQLPSSLRSIGKEAFAGGEGADVDRYAFSKLRIVRIGTQEESELRFIGEDAFADTPELVELSLFAKIPPRLGGMAGILRMKSVGMGSGFEYQKELIIYVPEESERMYKTADSWKKYSNRINRIGDELNPPTPIE